jgi:hypothetical protein
MDELEDIIEDLGVVRILLEPHEFDIDHVETLVGLGNKFVEQVIYGKCFHRRNLKPACAPFRERCECVGEAFSFSCGARAGGAPLTDG